MFNLAVPTHAHGHAHAHTRIPTHTSPAPSPPSTHTHNRLFALLCLFCRQTSTPRPQARVPTHTPHPRLCSEIACKARILRIRGWPMIFLSVHCRTVKKPVLAASCRGEVAGWDLEIKDSADGWLVGKVVLTIMRVLGAVCGGCCWTPTQ